VSRVKHPRRPTTTRFSQFDERRRPSRLRQSSQRDRRQCFLHLDRGAVVGADRHSRGVCCHIVSGDSMPSRSSPVTRACIDRAHNASRDVRSWGSAFRTGTACKTPRTSAQGRRGRCTTDAAPVRCQPRTPPRRSSAASERAPAHLTCRRLIWARNTPGLDTQVCPLVDFVSHQMNQPQQRGSPAAKTPDGRR
jgi:hypothetical protein